MPTVTVFAQQRNFLEAGSRISGVNAHIHAAGAAQYASDDAVLEGEDRFIDRGAAPCV